MARRLPLAVALLLAAAIAGCADDQAGGPGNTEGRTVSVSQEGWAEANLQMDAGAGITYEWNTTPAVTVDFDVHAHENGSVVVYRNETASGGKGSFEAPDDGTYSLFWDNRGEPTRLGVRIDGDFTLESFPVR